MPRKTQRSWLSASLAAAARPHGINSRVRVRRRRRSPACNQDRVLCRHPRRHCAPLPPQAMRRDSPTEAQEAGSWSDDICALFARKGELPALLALPILMCLSYLFILYFSGGIRHFTGLFATSCLRFLSFFLFFCYFFLFCVDYVSCCRISSTGVGTKGLSTEATRHKREVSRHGHGATYFVGRFGSEWGLDWAWLAPPCRF